MFINLVEDDIVCVVIDNGLGMCKVGFVGDDVLWVVFFVVIGWFRYDVR